MMQFTPEEQEALIKNSKMIFEYIKTEISPYIKSSVYLNFECAPRTIEMMFGVHPSKNNHIITMKRNRIDSTVYSVGSEYDWRNEKRAVDFYTCYEEMYYFIINWQKIKEKLIDEVNLRKHNMQIINNFQI